MSTGCVPATQRARRSLSLSGIPIISAAFFLIFAVMPANERVRSSASQSSQLVARMEGAPRPQSRDPVPTHTGKQRAATGSPDYGAGRLHPGYGEGAHLIVH